MSRASTFIPASVLKAIPTQSANRTGETESATTRYGAEQLGIKLHIIDIIDEYKEVVINPKHGYGGNMNPCLDCKIFMVGKAAMDG